MATQYTSILKLALPTEGELSGTWGDVVNDNITSMVEEAIAGRAVIDSWTANGHTLTTADGITAEARCAMLEFTDTNTDLTGNAEVICPTASKIYIAKNATGAGYSVTVKTFAGTGIAVPDGETMFLFCDGTNVVEAITSVKTLKIADGVQVNTILDEDNMASDSATALATQQSIKAYVDAQVTAQELDIAGDSGTGAIDLDSQSLTVAGTANEIETAASGQTITVGLPSVVIVTTSVTTPTVQATNINANDGSTSATIADSTGVMTIASSVLTTTDINGGTIDDTVIGGSTAAAGTFTTATTTTGVVTDTISERTATSGVTIDGVVLKDNGITATGGGSLTGTWSDLGSVTTVDINGGTIDGTTIGGASAGAITGTTITGTSFVSSGDMTFGDNDKAIFGAGSDLQIYHGGTSSRIQDLGTGNLIIDTNGTEIQLTSGNISQYMLRAVKDGAVTLYHNGTANPRLATTSTGIDVTGTVTADGLTVDGNSRINGDFTIDTAPRGYVFASTLEIGSGGTLAVAGNANTSLMSNIYFASDATYKVINTGLSAASHQLYSGSHVFYTASAGGTAGSSIDLFTRMNIARTGDISFYEPTGTNARIFYDASTQFVVNEDSADFDFRVESDANTHALFVDAGNSRVGIGTASPASLLDVNGGASASIITLSTTSGNPGARIHFLGSPSTFKNWAIGASAFAVNGALEFVPSTTNGGSTFTTPAMIIDSSNNVGIGTTSPSVLVEASKSQNAVTDIKVTNANTGTAAQARLTLGNSGSNIGALGFLGGSFTTSGVYRQDGVYVYSNGVGGLTLLTGAAQPIYFATNSAERMRITSGGTLQIAGGGNDNVGEINMGNTAQNANRFQVRHQSSAWYLKTVDSEPLVFGTANTERMRLDSSGNFIFNESGADADFRVESDTNTHMLFVDAGNNRVGIGQSSPATVLDVNASVSNSEGILRVYLNTATNDPTLKILQRGEGGNAGSTQGLLIDIAGQNAGDGKILNTNVINSNLNGGVAFSPFSVNNLGSFDFRQGGVVNESGGDADFRVESDTNTHALFVEGSSGNVSIGKSSPADKLDIDITAAAPSNSNFLGITVGPTSGSTAVGEGVGIGFRLRNTAGGGLGGNSFGGAIYGVQTDSAANTGGLAFYTRQDASTFSERMRLDSSGNLLVGPTSGSNHVIQKSAASAIALNINNSSATSPRGVSFTFSAGSPNDGTATFFTTADSTAYRGGWLSNGGVQNYQANDSNLSDRREKTNFSPAKSYLETICAIPVQTFNYIDQNMEEDPGLTLGVVAQDVQEVAPELIMESNWGTEENPKMRLSIYQTDLQYALMKALQELKAEFDAYKLTHP
jgi:hypothetical protein